MSFPLFLSSTHSDEEWAMVLSPLAATGGLFFDFDKVLSL